MNINRATHVSSDPDFTAAEVHPDLTTGQIEY